nr:YbjN domain-containing protein [Hyphomonas sp. Mor2]
MRVIATTMLAMGLCLGAQAQDTSRDAEQITSITKADMRYVINSASYTVTEDLSSGIGFVAETDEDLIFGAQGKACSGDDQDQEPCLGVEFFVVLEGDFDVEYANDVNQRWSAIKAVKLDSGALMLSRYLILDHGQTLQNLRLNMVTTTAIADQVREEKKPKEQEQLTVGQIEWGDDSGDYANDDACDDARFHDDGDDWSYQRNHVLHDATDCRTLYEAGSITLFLDFGNNSGEYADDNTCDDNRFTGEGRSILTTDSHVKRDSADCIVAYQNGRLNRP